jgi:hypothetical protein
MGILENNVQEMRCRFRPAKSNQTLDLAQGPIARPVEAQLRVERYQML